MNPEQTLIHCHSQQDNIALAADIRQRGNFRVERIFHLATMPSVGWYHCIQDLIFSILDMRSGENGHYFATHALPQVREFYRAFYAMHEARSFHQRVYETDDDSENTVIRMMLDAGMCGFLLEIAYPEPGKPATWEAEHRAFFYAESYEEALTAALLWLDANHEHAA